MKRKSSMTQQTGNLLVWADSRMMAVVDFEGAS